MSVDFSNTLIVAVSASVLFDMTETDAKFRGFVEQDATTAVANFRKYMESCEDEPLEAGAGYPLIRAILNLNRFDNKNKQYDNESPLVEVVIVSKNSPDTGIRILNALRTHQLNITRSAFLSGRPVVDYIDDFNVDLFLTTNKTDAQQVADANICACALLDATPVDTYQLDSEQLRIAFDGDAVLFDDSGELLYQQQGLKAFHDREERMAHLPIDKGPYADFLIKLSNLQKRLIHPINQEGNCIDPIQIALVTARNAPADLRAIKTLREWGIQVDIAFFLGGLEKTQVLQSFAPHIFFDDSIKHVSLAKSHVPTGLVPYQSDSVLHQKKLDKQLLQSADKQIFHLASAPTNRTE